MSIEVKNLTHVYNKGMAYETVAISDVSFTVEDRQFAGIIGHTGSGKSTLLQHLNGLIKPDSGTIIVNGIDITAQETVMKDVRRMIGLVFQYPEYQLFEQTVAEDVAFGPKNLGMNDDEINERVRESLELVGLDYDKIADVNPFDLSGGQKRRVAIAGVIAMKPSVLILDEPTAGLNPKAHQDILEMVMNIHKASKGITIFVSHNMNDIAAMSDRVLVMNGGRLVMNDTPENVFSRETELKEMGLALPDSMEIASRLRKGGIEIPDLCMDMDKLADSIAAGIQG